MIFYCYVCKYETNINSNIHKHFRTKKHNSNIKNFFGENLFCNYCNTQFKSVELFNTHLIECCHLEKKLDIKHQVENEKLKKSIIELHNKYNNIIIEKDNYIKELENSLISHGFTVNNHNKHTINIQQDFINELIELKNNKVYNTSKNIDTFQKDVINKSSNINNSKNTIESQHVTNKNNVDNIKISNQKVSVNDNVITKKKILVPQNNPYINNHYYSHLKFTQKSKNLTKQEKRQLKLLQQQKK